MSDITPETPPQTGLDVILEDVKTEARRLGAIDFEVIEINLARQSIFNQPPQTETERERLIIEARAAIRELRHTKPHLFTKSALEMSREEYAQRRADLCYEPYNRPLPTEDVLNMPTADYRKAKNKFLADEHARMAYHSRNQRPVSR